jgi:RHS repeat-associated protein
MLTGNGRTIIYTAFNKPKTVQGPSGTTTLTYDANYSRIVKAAPGGATTYIGKLYEKFENGSTTIQKQHIYAGNNLVGTYYTPNSGSSYIHYFHSDHLGSVEAITNGSAGVVQRLSYDAFGKRRNPYGTDAISITAQTTRGFTRHEHDDEVGLVNMNAREYDPLLGRFISPDTIIPGTTNSQSYNRYSYTNNNPLSMVDPTGNWSLKKVVKKVVKAVVGSAFGAPASASLYIANQKSQIADFTSRILQRVSGISYVGGLLSTGLLAGTQFGYAYGWSTGDWQTVGRAHATGAVLAAGAWAAPNLTALQWYGYPTYIGAETALGYVSGYSLARINGASSAQARAAGQDVAKFGFIVSSGTVLYNEIVGYEATWKSGGEAKPKTSVTYPYEGANNFGTANPSIDPNSWFGEGGRLSRALNAVPGINAIAGMHDVFQVELQNWGGALTRNLLNVPGMPVATVLTTPALFDGALGFAAYACGNGGYCDPYAP